VCLGRPASGERFARGLARQRFELRRAGRPLVVERTRIEGGSPLLDAAHGLGGAPVSGTLLASLDPGAPPPEALLEEVRALAAALPAGARAAATAVEGALIVRYLGGHAAGAHALFVAVWERLRPALLGRAPCRPRIWMT
jgi:urease accessory protein